MKATWMVGVVVLVLAASVSLAEDKVEPKRKGDVREQLDTLIPEATRLLEKKEYKKVLELLVPPELMAKLTEKSNLDDFAKEFGQEKAGQLLAMLKAIKGVKPEMDKEGKRATYQLKEKVKDVPRDKIIFVKIDKYWYVQN
jgi:hypothetical protein